MLQSRRGFLIGAGSLLTAAFVSDARSFIRRNGRPLLASPPQVAQTLHWYQGDDPDAGCVLTLGRMELEPPPTPTWRNFLISEGFALHTEAGAAEAYNMHGIEPEDYDKRVYDWYWWDRFMLEDGPWARAETSMSAPISSQIADLW